MNETIGDEQPTAGYTASTYSPTRGQTVSFNASASRDLDGTITSYRWVWGDGRPNGSGAKPTHVYATAGQRSTTLYVTDSNGKSATITHTITVH